MIVLLDGPEWLITTDPKNIGREGRWFDLVLRRFDVHSRDGKIDIEFVDRCPPSGACFSRMRVYDARNRLVAEDSVATRSLNRVGWLALATKGELTDLHGGFGYYRKDDWAKKHPVFDGMPAGGIMDYTFHREIIPDIVYSGHDGQDEAIAGSLKPTFGYASGTLVSAHRLGAGFFVLSTLKIRENLGRYPAAERLLRNMLNYASANLDRAPEPLPTDFDNYLKAIRYR